jgi:hypothetical protein
MCLSCVYNVHTNLNKKDGKMKFKQKGKTYLFNSATTKTPLMVARGKTWSPVKNENVQPILKAQGIFWANKKAAPSKPYVFSEYPKSEGV